VAADCTGFVSPICKNGFCVTSCGDGVKDGTETDVDCGGQCSANCDAGQGCNSGFDCKDKICSNGKCVAGTCSDGVRNVDESDVDCGGGTCPDCRYGKDCGGNSDCISGYCTSDKCRSPLNGSCSDGSKNNLETDTDCGGGACAPCSFGKACLINADCTSGNCTGTPKTCQ
jgi:hypothetical protein